MNVAVEAEGLGKRFDDHEVLGGIDLHVPAGSVLGLLGPNGAGKTTIVRILTTLLPPDAGRARVAGFDVVTQPQKVRQRIGLAGQYAAVDEKLTGRENLRLIGRLYRLGKRGAAARADELLGRFDLEDAADRPAKTYSGGMRRRLDLAACLIANPPVLFLDEPTTGLDLSSRLLLWSMVREQVALGVTVVLTTQYLEEADQLAHNIVVVDQGRICAQGRAADLKRAVGGDRLEVVLSDPRDMPAAYNMLSRTGSDLPVPAEDGRSLMVALPPGVAAIGEAANALASAGVGVTAFTVRQPSMDEVFLALVDRTPRGERSRT